MKNAFSFLAKTILSGFLIIIPLYLAVLLLLKAMATVGKLVVPFTKLLPEWVPADQLLSLLLVLLICFLIGGTVKTPAGRKTRNKIESKFFERIPGYALVRSLTQQLAGSTRDNVWKPVLAEIEEALVPAFIIEEFEDGRFTVFVPSIPTPLAGAVYILESNRVHSMDVQFTDALRVISRWGSGAKDIVLAMERKESSKS